MGLDYDLLIASLFSQADQKYIPLSGAFELTSRCPLDCKMCYVHRKENDCEAIKSEKSTEWWLSLAEEAKNAGMFMLLLTGGEPLLRRDFEEIYLGIKRMGVLVSVNTNGLLIDDKAVKFFADNPPQKLNITLYGASEQTYSELCGNGKAYQKVVDAINKLVQAGVNVKLNYTVTQYNKDDAAQIYEFARKLKLPVQTVSYMFPPIRAAGGVTDRMPPEEAAKVHFNCKLLERGEEKLTQHLEAKADRKLTVQTADTGGEQIPCRAGRSTFWVTWDGKLTPCGMMTEPAFEINGFKEAWSDITKARESIYLPPECKNCDMRNYCDVCAAVSFAETGSFSKVPSYVCKKTAQYKKICDEFLNRHKNYYPRQ